MIELIATDHYLLFYQPRFDDRLAAYRRNQAGTYVLGVVQHFVRPAAILQPVDHAAKPSWRAHGGTGDQDAVGFQFEKQFGLLIAQVMPLVIDDDKRATLASIRTTPDESVPERHVTAVIALLVNEQSTIRLILLVKGANGRKRHERSRGIVDLLRRDLRKIDWFQGGNEMGVFTPCCEVGESLVNHHLGF